MTNSAQNNCAQQTSVHNQEKGVLKFGAKKTNVQRKNIGAQKYVAHNSSNLAPNMDARK